MEYRKLGQAAVRVSPICLGTMNFGDRTDFAEAEKIVKSAFDAGINFIDTADVYVKGESERMVGKLIAREREHWVLATKVANATGKGPNESGFSRKHIMRAIDESLARLDTDYVDIYYLHFDDTAGNLAEALEAMADIVACGKAHYVGLSNFRGWRIAAAAELCRQEGFPVPGCMSALLQRHEPHAGSRSPAGLRALWHGHRPLQPACARHPDRHVQARRQAAGRFARGAQGYAHHGNRVPRGVHRHGADHRAPRQKTRHDRAASSRSTGC